MTIQAIGIVFAFLFGAVVGSFLNVVIWRVPRGESIVSPGSHCPGCGKPIAWYHNVPIVSWLVLRGRCASCGTPIDVRYPMVELVTALLAVACVAVFGLGLEAVRIFVFVAILVSLTYIDLEHWLLPHAITWPGIVVGLATAWVPGAPGLKTCAIGAAAGLGGLALVGLVARRILGQDAMGGGDPFLLGMIGAFLGWAPLGPVIFLASVQGIVGWGVLALRRRDEEAEAAPPTDAPPTDAPPEDDAGVSEDDWVPPANAVPFGPFLSLGALEMTFAGGLVMDWLLRVLGLG